MHVNVLSIKGLEKSYGKIKALKGVSFDIPQGSVFGLLGPNGSGKTTLLSIILDVLQADAGQFSWFDQPGSPAIRKQIGSLLETPNFYHYLSGVGNLKVTQSINGRGTKADIDEVLKQVKLYERRKSRFSTYSLGMKQRLAIAAALLGKPKVLVLDEPTNGLDPVGIAEMRQLILDLRDQGYTIIMASHLLDEVERICSHVAILKTGELMACGEVSEVLTDEDIIELSAPDLLTLREAILHFPGITAIKQQQGSLLIHMEKGKGDTVKLNEYCFHNGLILSHLVSKKQRLEDKFFELTGA